MPISNLLTENEITKTIFLYDSSSNLDKLKTVIHEKDSLIITFDFESHKQLLEKNISHEISDNFISKKDVNEIQNNSYIFTKWCEDKSISNDIIFEDINLGNLLFSEFRLFLVPFLKKFLEITKIYQKFPNSKYFSSFELFPFISIHTSNVQKINFYEKHTKSSQSIVKYGFNFGGKYFHVPIPNKYFKKLKSLSELLLKNRLNSKINKNKKTVLLLEFSPTRFKHFFLNIPNSDINIVLHNRRYPSVWNKSSYSILKKSNCVVTTEHLLMNKKTKKLIYKNARIVNSQINQLLNDNLFLEDFFNFYQISFWKILKPFLVKMFEQYIYEYIYEIELTKKLFTKYHFSSILITNEIGYHEQIAITLAKKFDVKISLIQHGLYDDTPEALDYNQTGVLPSQSDKFLVWGNSLKKYSIDCGIPSEKIEVIGNPAYDDFFMQSKKSDFTNSFVLLTTTNPQSDIVYDLTVDSLLQREETIEQICKIMTKLNKKLIIKLHPNPDDIDITKFVQKINPDISVVKYGDVFDLLKNCEIFLTLNTSTTILEAQICKKPTISLSVVERGFGNPEIFKSKSCLSIKIDDFEQIFSKLDKDEVFKKNVISNGYEFSKEYLSNQGTASEHLLKFLEKF